MAANEEELELERDILGVGDGAGFWLLYDQSSRHWIRKRTFIDVSVGTSDETVYDFWVKDVRDDLGLQAPALPSVYQAQFVALISGNKPSLSQSYVSRADLKPKEYPRVPKDYDYYTVMFAVREAPGLWRRFMRELEADDWVHAERQVLHEFADAGYEPGVEVLIADTIRGGPGYYEPEGMIYTTHDGQPPSN